MRARHMARPERPEVATATRSGRVKASLVFGSGGNIERKTRFATVLDGYRWSGSPKVHGGTPKTLDSQVQRGTRGTYPENLEECAQNLGVEMKSRLPSAECESHRWTFSSFGPQCNFWMTTFATISEIDPVSQAFESDRTSRTLCTTPAPKLCEFSVIRKSFTVCRRRRLLLEFWIFSLHSMNIVTKIARSIF